MVGQMWSCYIGFSCRGADVPEPVVFLSYDRGVQVTLTFPVVGQRNLNIEYGCRRADEP